MRIIIISILALALSGCASSDGYQQYLQAHQEGQRAYYEAAAKPLVDISLPAPNGQEYHIVVNREIRPVNPEQERPSEWAPVASKAISGATVVGGIVAGAELAGTLLSGAGTRIEGDGNQYQSSGNGDPVLGNSEIAAEPEEDAGEIDIQSEGVE